MSHPEKSPAEPQQWFTIKQAAKFKGVTERTVRNWLLKGLVVHEMRRPNRDTMTLHIDRASLESVPLIPQGRHRTPRKP